MARSPVSESSGAGFATPSKGMRRPAYLWPVFEGLGVEESVVPPAYLCGSGAPSHSPRCEISSGCSVEGVVHPSYFGEADWDQTDHFAKETSDGHP